MWKTMTAGVTALALALTPVQASANDFNEEDFGKFLFGLVAAIAVGNLLKNVGDDDDDAARRYHDDPAARDYYDDPAYIPRAPVVQPRRYADDGRIAPRDNGFRNDGHRGNGNRGNGNGYGLAHQQSRLLPANCFYPVETRYGDVRMFGRNCLRNAGVRIDRLPEHCAVRVHGKNGVRNGFDPRCLRQDGYRIARH